MDPSTPLPLRRYHVEEEGGAAALDAVCLTCGPDLVVVVCGGQRHHVGAVALGLSVPSANDPARRSQSSYLASVPGHEEEGLARDGCLRLAGALQRHVVVTVGIHDDGISKAGVAAYVALFGRLMDEIARDHAGRPSPSPSQ